MADSFPQDSDQALIDRFRESGRMDYLDILLKRHLAVVHRTVYQMVLEPTTADDVTQEIFLRVVRGIERFDGRSQFSTWLFRITMNTVKTHLKKTKRLREQTYAELPDTVLASTVAPDSRILLAELTTATETAMSRLSPILRSAIVLVCLQGRSTTEAAEIEGCSTDAMYRRVHEARRQLKHFLGERLS